MSQSIPFSFCRPVFLCDENKYIRDVRQFFFQLPDYFLIRKVTFCNGQQPGFIQQFWVKHLKFLQQDIIFLADIVTIGRIP